MPPASEADTDDSNVQCPLLTGPENALVEPAIASVFQAGGPCFNPLVFFGPSGTGKSHVLLGLAETWRSRFGRGRRVEYVTAVDFARELNDAVDRQATEDFRDRFRRAALLLIDDLDWLRGRPVAQEELLFTIDALLANGGLVVVTMRTAPEALPGAFPALRSRLAAGLSIPLVPPAEDTRLELLHQFARLQQIELSAAAAELLARGLKGSVPELAGALRELVAETDSPPRRITVELARRLIQRRRKGAVPPLSEIAAATARHFGLRVADLRGPTRRREVVVARDIAVYLARKITESSLEQVGKYFGGRDHTTIMHSVRKVEGLQKKDSATAAVIDELRQRWRHVTQSG